MKILFYFTIMITLPDGFYKIIAVITISMLSFIFIRYINNIQEENITLKTSVAESYKALNSCLLNENKAITNYNNEVLEIYSKDSMRNKLSKFEIFVPKLNSSIDSTANIFEVYYISHGRLKSFVDIKKELIIQTLKSENYLYNSALINNQNQSQLDKIMYKTTRHLLLGFGLISIAFLVLSLSTLIKVDTNKINGEHLLDDINLELKRIDLKIKKEELKRMS